MGAANFINESFYSTPQAVPVSYCLRAAASPLHITVQSQDQLGYILASRFVAKQFSKAYRAQCQQFAPTLLTIKRNRDICGALGVRLASQERLYLEQYLASDIEHALSDVFAQPISRDSIIEVGNFSASKGGVSQLLLLAVGHALRLLGYRWLVFTATSHVQKMLDRMQWQVTPLCEAKAEYLDDPASNWGNYYADKPKVVVGDLWAAAAQLQHPSVTQLFGQHRVPVRRIEASLRGIR